VVDRGTLVLPDSTQGRSIEFRNVWFSYPAAEPSANGSDPRWVLQDVSFRVPAGNTLAIVGATGSGKSALLDLIPRLFEPQRGEILLDGVPITSVPLSSLRAQIGYVPQDTLLFSETIGTNVAYGIDDARRIAIDQAMEAAAQTQTAEHATATRDDVIPEVIEATQIAQLSDTVTALPAGYATPLGERGINLSGGQKQRTALARALARGPRMVLLDDALSAVDTQTEAAILRGLRTALQGRTAIIASHRISTVRDADWILVLDGGTVAEQGRHEDLMAHDGRYSQLLHRQQLLEQVEAA